MTTERPQEGYDDVGWDDDAGPYTDPIGVPDGQWDAVQDELAGAGDELLVCMDCRDREGCRRAGWCALDDDDDDEGLGETEAELRGITPPDY